MPIRRGEGIYQIEMDDFINRVRGGNWVQIYPEGRTYQVYSFLEPTMRRMDPIVIELPMAATTRPVAASRLLIAISVLISS